LFIVNYNKLTSNVNKILYKNTIIIGSAIATFILSIGIFLLFKIHYNIKLCNSIYIFLLTNLIIAYEIFRKIYIAKGLGLKLLLMSLSRFILYFIGLFVYIYFDQLSLNKIFLIFSLSLFLVLLIFKDKQTFLTYNFFYKFKFKIVKNLKEDWKQNQYLFSKAIVHYFTAQIYILIVGIFIGADSSAIFEVIRLYFIPIMIFAVGINNILAVYLTKLYKTNKKIFIKTFVNILLCWVVIVVIYCIFVYFNIFLIDNIIFNGKYYNKEFGINLIIFSFAAFSSSILIILGNVFVITNTNKYTLKASLIVFLINLVFAPVIIYSYGLRGAFIGTCFIQIMLLSLNIYYFLKVKNEVVYDK
jgi:O-antigen/teichoic acid export membrane protein